MPTTQIAQELETQADQAGKEQLFVVTPRLEQSFTANLEPLLIPFGLSASLFRKNFGGTATD